MIRRGGPGDLPSTRSMSFVDAVEGSHSVRRSRPDPASRDDVLRFV